MSAFAACLAYLLEADEPRAADPAEARGWLAGRNLGLVPVREPEGFTWPGPFLARLGGPDAWVVMFGVPPGVLHDPAGGTASGPPEEAFVLAPLNRGVAPGEHPYGRPQAGRGRVEAIVIAPAAEAAPTAVRAGRGDRRPRPRGRPLRRRRAAPSRPAPAAGGRSR